MEELAGQARAVRERLLELAASARALRGDLGELERMTATDARNVESSERRPS
jgi:hypothetical protein